MEEKTRCLVELQGYDSKMDDIEIGRKKGPEKIKSLKESLEKISKEKEDAASQLEACKRERRQIEQHIEDLEERINKSNIKLGSIKSNKEYKAVLKEVADLQSEKMASEDRALELPEPHFHRIIITNEKLYLPHLRPI